MGIKSLGNPNASRPWRAGKKGPKYHAVWSETGLGAVNAPPAPYGGTGVWYGARGIWGGGRNNPTWFSEIYYKEIASLGNAEEFGDLTLDKANSSNSMTSSTRMVFTGGTMIGLKTLITGIV